MNILPKRLKEARTKAGFKQIDAAKKLGISNGTLSGYERNYRDPDTDILHKMSDLYDVSIDWLLGKSDDPKMTEQQEILKESKSEQDTLMFYNWKNMNEEEKEEALNMIQYILYRKRGNKDGES